jgi:ribonuclease HI
VSLEENLNRVVVYTDGACIGNPGPGGYGVVILNSQGRQELSGGYSLTTNNRMELMAVISGLEYLPKRCKVRLYSDSEYVVKAIEHGWARKWKANNFRRENKEVPNADLWERLLAQCSQHEVEFRWVRGHASSRENICSDKLASKAARSPLLPPDEGYVPRS